jgi:hypothetical protein
MQGIRVFGTSLGVPSLTEILLDILLYDMTELTFAAFDTLLYYVSLLHNPISTVHASTGHQPKLPYCVTGLTGICINQAEKFIPGLLIADCTPSHILARFGDSFRLNVSV